MLDFPSSPTVGQVYDKWTWDGIAWMLSGGRGRGNGFTFVQDTQPTASMSGDTWFNTTTAQSYVWIDDGNSTQWVQFAPGRKFEASQISFAPTVVPVPPYQSISSTNVQDAVLEIGNDIFANCARGIIHMGTVEVKSGTGIAAGAVTKLTWTAWVVTNVGRRYRAFYRMRAVTTSGYIWVRLNSNNANVTTNDSYSFVGGSYNHLDLEIIFDGNGSQSQYWVECAAGAAATIYSGDQASSKFYIEDIGPAR